MFHINLQTGKFSHLYRFVFLILSGLKTVISRREKEQPAKVWFQVIPKLFLADSLDKRNNTCFMPFINV